MTTVQLPLFPVTMPLRTLDDVAAVVAGALKLPPLTAPEQLNTEVRRLHNACFEVIYAAYLDETLSQREYLLLKEALFAWSGRYYHWLDRLSCAQHGRRWSGVIETPDAVLTAYERVVVGFASK